MVENIFKGAWRNLVKNKAHSFINITGLAVGMAVAMLIGLWIWDEVSFDTDNADYDRIAQVMQNQAFNGGISTGAAMPMPLADELRNRYGSDFKNVVLSSFTWTHILAAGEKKLLQPGNFMEAQSPELLDLKMIKGVRSALKDPGAILLSESLVRALYGSADPMGKTLLLDNKMNVKVSGIYRDFPENSSFHDLHFIVPWDQYFVADESLKTARDNWNNNSFQLFVRVAGPSNISSVSAKIKNAKRDKVSAEEAKFNPTLLLHPMSRWHLYEEFKNGVNAGGRIQYIWLFGLIGLFVLLLACINFMNLSTARSEKRAKEVGIRKAIGSLRRQLIVQFFSESLLVVALAFFLSLLLVQLVLPFFNEVADKKLSILWNNPSFWSMSLGFCLVTGLIAGSYPALYLSSFQPVKVLKGVFRAGPLAAIPRKVLVVLQFTVSIVLIIGTIVVFRQIQFARNRQVGYNREGLITMELYTDDLHNHFSAFRNDLLKTGAVTAVAESQSNTEGINNHNAGFTWKGKDPNTPSMFATIGVSPGYGEAVGWQLADGRDFSTGSPSDSAGMILNEAMVNYMGLQHPVGETIGWYNKNYRVIGVVHNMMVESPYEPASPVIFFIDHRPSNYVHIRLKAGSNTEASLNKVQAVFRQYNPSIPFSFQFADEGYARKFAAEERIGKLAGFFASLAIFISCLGLFGMASFMAEQRIKEIGVRKVLGASVLNLWGLLSKEFVFLILISLLVAIPLSYYFMHHWLGQYTYRSALSWWIFAVTGLASLGITLITVSYQAVRAALANPVRSLRADG